MKLLALVDIHGATDKVKALRKKFEKKDVDLVACLGDLTNEGTIPVVKEILENLRFGKKLVVVPGNMDGQEVLKLLEKEKVLLHKASFKMEGYTFIGLGGGIPKNTWYKCNVGELEIEKFLAKELEGLSQAVLLTHVPPFGVGIDEVSAGYGLGSRKLTGIIERFQPVIHLCGHAHEAKGEARINQTPSINIGPLAEGNALWVELEKGKRPAFKRVKV